MSIKSLFEDIAEAIREKSGSSDTYTPAEMPSAIRSIPSGSSTASGVTYDNTTSGLTASNVQDAIDELAGDVSTITSDLSELVLYQTIDGTMDSIPGNTKARYRLDDITIPTGYEIKQITVVSFMDTDVITCMYHDTAYDKYYVIARNFNSGTLTNQSFRVYITYGKVNS